MNLNVTDSHFLFLCTYSVRTLKKNLISTLGGCASHKCKSSNKSEPPAVLELELNDPIQTSLSLFDQHRDRLKC